MRTGEIKLYRGREWATKKKQTNLKQKGNDCTLFWWGRKENVWQIGQIGIRKKGGMREEKQKLSARAPIINALLAESRGFRGLG